mmetsp:Transcript_55640/g.129538  ORF Transcript_55640/g.129538 Transcript_55640/m.129538 type:complete len:195 (+) Transcript_55640:182-766(+)|eukprot:CAMPEP_0171097336 /NCGR_PEP_ID=MMETSP0766_2-20121228/47486_1 /TAXON_ID=439317 /ORGANISM="Gambierdiscus australes, Strain CAWD 149" /LENGTH=194 /DNA_ID=CAMNT_0011556519 /DNA_START=180 /DNA_END=764 /DNA_ORIENTATION=+
MEAEPPIALGLKEHGHRAELDLQLQGRAMQNPTGLSVRRVALRGPRRAFAGLDSARAMPRRQRAVGTIGGRVEQLMAALRQVLAGMQAAAATVGMAMVKRSRRSATQETSITLLSAVDFTMVCCVLMPLLVFAGTFGIATLADAGGDCPEEESEESGSKLMWVLKLVAVAYVVSVMDGAVDPMSPLRSALISGI